MNALFGTDRLSARAKLGDALRLAGQPASGNRRPGATGWIAALLYVALTATAARAVTIDWVTVGDPGNAADTTGLGKVDYAYRIGKYEVTIAQYTEFLNAVAKSDPYSLYDTRMSTFPPTNGIARSGASGSYTYSVMTDGGYSGNRPIAYITWFNAARFANWMENGQGTGGTETGAYTLVGGQTGGSAVARNPGARFSLPTPDEWYKAAYYKGGSPSAGYWTYATQSNTDPGFTVGNGWNQANYDVDGGGPGRLTDVGSFSGSPSAYGTFDQNGNVWEWNSDSSDYFRGGEWGYFALQMTSNFNRNGGWRGSFNPNSWGFRLASPASAAVPEIDPAGFASVLALVTGALGLVERKKRRRS